MMTKQGSTKIVTSIKEDIYSLKQINTTKNQKKARKGFEKLQYFYLMKVRGDSILPEMYYTTDTYQFI